MCNSERFFFSQPENRRRSTDNSVFVGFLNGGERREWNEDNAGALTVGKSALNASHIWHYLLSGCFHLIFTIWVYFWADTRRGNRNTKRRIHTNLDCNFRIFNAESAVLNPRAQIHCASHQIKKQFWVSHRRINFTHWKWLRVSVSDVFIWRARAFSSTTTFDWNLDPVNNRLNSLDCDLYNSSHFSGSVVRAPARKSIERLYAISISVWFFFIANDNQCIAYRLSIHSFLEPSGPT